MATEVPVRVREQTCPLEDRPRGVLRLLLVSARPHQWAKNLFVLAPLLFGMKLGDPRAVTQGLLACAVFCLLSSGLYLFNDLIDVRKDRIHPEKRRRPIASGALPLLTVVTFCAALVLTALALAVWVGPGFLLLASAYLALTAAYCVCLKHTLVLDCMVIAAGFVLRVVAGAVSVDVQPSHWLIICAFLLALYLAFAKRRQELLKLTTGAAAHRRVLGQYTVGYLDQVNILLAGSAIICYALYTVAPDTVARFGTEHLIYGTAFVVYGLLRYMALIRDSEYGGDPSKVLLRDRPLLLATLGWVMYNAVVIYRDPLQALGERLTGVR
jgi:4-hydroxybenzoate polyprenyltransferase